MRASLTPSPVIATMAPVRCNADDAELVFGIDPRVDGRFADGVFKLLIGHRLERPADHRWAVRTDAQLASDRDGGLVVLVIMIGRMPAPLALATASWLQGGADRSSRPHPGTRGCARGPRRLRARAHQWQRAKRDTERTDRLAGPAPRWRPDRGPSRIGQRPRDIADELVGACACSTSKCPS